MLPSTKETSACPPCSRMQLTWVSGKLFRDVFREAFGEVLREAFGEEGKR